MKRFMLVTVNMMECVPEKQGLILHWQLGEAIRNLYGQTTILQNRLIW